MFAPKAHGLRELAAEVNVVPRRALTATAHTSPLVPQRGWRTRVGVVQTQPRHGTCRANVGLRQLPQPDVLDLWPLCEVHRSLELALPAPLGAKRGTSRGRF